ncbi:MAG TPA: hypothetical protein PLS24_09580 [Sedimentisphaerales bacterium]|nr:hypothetical protein [Sedimentisphaerales bacterium]HOV78269.1 hypothetical protein [Sedimentisphaerales bacterium]HQI26733.1 hypothetical protein [Sedimentisphaerales bacterium]
MDKFEEICRKRKLAHQKFLAADSKVYRAFLDMESAAYADGALTRKHKGLIQVGIEMGGGRATVSARFALDVMEKVFGS